MYGVVDGGTGRRGNRTVGSQHSALTIEHREGRPCLRTTDKLMLRLRDRTMGFWRIDSHMIDDLGWRRSYIITMCPIIRQALPETTNYRANYIYIQIHS